MNVVNIRTQERVVPCKIGGAYNITWENSTDLLKSLGWRIEPILPVPETGYERLTITYVEGDDGVTAKAIYTDTLIQDRLEAEAEQVRLAEEARQNNKSQALKETENKFLLICEQITGSKTKLGFDEVEVILTNLMATDQNTAVVLSIKLLGIDAAGKRCGGNLWWDDIEWHDDIV